MKTTLKKTLSRTFFFLFLFLLIEVTGFAQGTKPHYLVNNAVDAKETETYYDLLSNFNFDQYRFYDKRRTITFVKSAITVELYSAKELLETYQKSISPLTIMDNIPQTDIAFLMYAGKVQIVKIKK
jgi:hypothetical protein